MRAPGPAVDLAEAEFERLAELILRASGIHMRATKRPLVAQRLRSRLRHLGLPGFGEYLALLDRRPEELDEILDRITTQETAFFREPWQFDFLRRDLFPEYRRDAAAGRRPRRVRVWSAACATGEEPYSLAMVAAEELPESEGWHVDVLATDLSRQALARTRSACWSEAAAAAVPSTLRNRWLLTDGSGRRCARPELRRRVRVRRLNLVHDPYPRGFFDLVLCRNALIYLHREARQAVLARLVERLMPRGCLLLGHAETAQGSGAELRPVAPSIYRRRRLERPAGGGR